MERTNGIENLNGINHKWKLHSLNVEKQFQKHYPEELSKLTVLNPIERSSLISFLFAAAESNGISDGSLQSSCNRVLSNVGLLELTEYSYNVLKNNSGTNMFDMDRAVIIGINHALLNIGADEHYSYNHGRMDNDVPEVITELSTAENKAVQLNRVEKQHERVLEDFFSMQSNYDTFKEVTFSDDTMQKYMKEIPESLYKGRKLYFAYLDKVNLFNSWQGESYSLVKDIRPVSEPVFTKALSEIRFGSIGNVPRLLKYFIILSRDG